MAARPVETLKDEGGRGKTHERSRGLRAERRGARRSVTPRHAAARCAGRSRRRSCPCPPPAPQGVEAGRPPDRQAGGRRGRHRSRAVPEDASRRRRSSPSWSRPASCRRSQQRIGQDPLVIKPLREIGKYGGTWRRGFTGPFDTSNGHRVAQNDKLLYFDYTGTKIVPNIARGWEVSQDGKVTTLLLRRGMKWSDGQPFTADDFVFWYEDVYQNKELVPTPLTRDDDQRQADRDREGRRHAPSSSSRPTPYYALPTVLASVWGIGHHARFGRDALGGFAPAHYLKQFHPKYASEAEHRQEGRRAQVRQLGHAASRTATTPAANPDLPVVTPWKTTPPINTPTLDARAQPVQRVGRHRRATSSRTSTASR